jgi:hypothetical protein
MHPASEPVFLASDQRGFIRGSTVTADIGAYQDQGFVHTTATFDQTKAHNSGSTIPITIQVTNAQGQNVGSSSLQVTAVSVVGPGGVLMSPGNSQPRNLFTFNPTTGTYLFNLKTTGYPSGTYTFNFTVGTDPTTHSVSFVIA